MTDPHHVEAHAYTPEEWAAHVAGRLAELGCSREDLEAMARTGDWPDGSLSGPHRRLWLDAFKPTGDTCELLASEPAP